MTRTDTTTEPLTIQGHFIQHLHTALDGGDMVEAEATISNLFMLSAGDGTTWATWEREAFAWLFGLYLDHLATTPQITA